MRLSWNEVRVRAAAFAAEWKDARYEKGETLTAPILDAARRKGRKS